MFEPNCCKNCSNNPRNNPLASGFCSCVLPSMEMQRFISEGKYKKITTNEWKTTFNNTEGEVVIKL